MSKTTKAIAVLGVVAGLGVAALPFNAMAADLTPLTGNNTTPVTDKVNVKTTIKDYISIELSAGGEGTFDAADATDATATDKFHIHTLDLGKLVNGGAIVEGNLLVNVKTNNAKGYKLGLAATGGTSLTGKNDATNTIAAGVPTVGNSAWSFKVEKGGDSAAGYDDMTIEPSYTAYQAVIPTTNTRIARYSAATDNSGMNTKVTFGVSASASQVADEYSQTVTFTAATDATAAF